MKVENKNKAFTLLEIIIAVFIIIVGIVGVHGFFSRLISQASSNSSRLIATYLAQEGIELVRNIRDENWLEGTTTTWDDGLDICQPINNKFCEIDYDDTELTSTSTPYTGTLLNLDQNDFYSYNLTTKPTKFKRKIAITKITADEIKVSVLVEWQEKGNFREVSIIGHLYDWK